MLKSLPETLYKDREEFEKILAVAVKKAGLKLAATVKKAIFNALGERDETAAICRDSNRIRNFGIPRAFRWPKKSKTSSTAR